MENNAELPKPTFSDHLQKIFSSHDANESEYLNLREVITNQEFLTEGQRQGIDQYKSLKHLSLSDIGLKTTNNFPSLPDLRTLDVSNNKFEGKHITEIINLYPKLEKLKLENNLIESIAELKGLEGSQLIKIDLEGNPLIFNEKDYKKKIFEMYPSIIVVDKEDKIGEYVYTSIASYVEESECEEFEKSSLEFDNNEDDGIDLEENESEENDGDGKGEEDEIEENESSNNGRDYCSKEEKDIEGKQQEGSDKFLQKKHILNSSTCQEEINQNNKKPKYD